MLKMLIKDFMVHSVRGYFTYTSFKLMTYLYMYSVTKVSSKTFFLKQNNVFCLTCQSGIVWWLWTYFQLMTYKHSATGLYLNFFH